jgi:hypothetical protein
MRVRAAILLATFARASSSGTHAAGSSSGECPPNPEPGGLTCDQCYETYGTAPRTAAAWGCSASREFGEHHSHNAQLILLALSLVLVGGGMVQHFFSWIPLPYTCQLLVVGILFGLWVLQDPSFTLQPGMKAGSYSWGDHDDDCKHVLQCAQRESNSQPPDPARPAC